MRKDDKLIFCMLRKDELCFMLNQRAWTPVKPEDYEGIRLYWAPKDIHKTTDPLQEVEAPDRLCTKKCEMRRRLA